MEGIVEATSWNAFDAISAMSFEESEFMTQLLGAYPFSAEQDHDLNLAMPSMYWSDHAAAAAAADDTNYSAPPEYQTYYYESEPNVVPTISAELQEGTVFFAAAQEPMVTPSFSFGCLNEETSCDDDGGLADCGPASPKQVVVHNPKPQMKRKFYMGEFDKPTEEDDQKLKKAKSSSSQVKNPKPKKTKKSSRNADEEESNVNVAANAQGSSSCNSEDDSNVNGKTRASRGSATDPQSLYARKRRERINERLRILQNLVPNGTKVDISTMLEEAVQYVKFLQLQIKLLSSNELWMYAPLAYNGMDIGLDMKISLPEQ